MKKNRQASFAPLRGLPIQLYAFTALPLTILLLFITFVSVALHQNDMRSLVGEHDERAVQSAAAALDSEIHHRAATIASLVVFAGNSDDVPFNELLATSSDLLYDFDGGVAFLDVKWICRLEKPNGFCPQWTLRPARCTRAGGFDWRTA